MRYLMLTLFMIINSFCIGQNATYSTIESIIPAVYDVISGPKGERDWNQFHNLFHSNAILGSTIKDSLDIYRFISFTPKGYQDRNQPFFERNNFFEEELTREVTSFGGLAMVASTYQFKFEKDGPIIQKGTNHIQLIKENGRWWITSLIWEAEG